MKNNKQAALKKLFREEALGELPLFYALTNLDFPERNPNRRRQYTREISITKYQTTFHQTNGFHKPISKIT